MSILTIPRLGGTLIITYTPGSGPPLQYLNAICITRDMLVQARTRDMQATAQARDEQANAKTRG